MTLSTASGFITMQACDRRKAPGAAVRKNVVEIDPYSDHDFETVPR